MKKRLFLACSLMLMTIVVMAIPSQRGLVQTITLADGTTVQVELVGDEHLHYFVDAAGTRYQEVNGTLEVLTDEMLAQRKPARVLHKSGRKTARRLPGLRKITMGEKTSYEGEKKGLVILAQYTDVQFKTANNKAKYERILNEENFSSAEGFQGSVYDYFKAQSNGKFELTFDVYGPITLAHNQRYYGANDSDGNDLRPEEMVIEAVNMLQDELDLSRYDWDNDGEVDQVFILYAGKGEADGGWGTSNTVWPHMWSLEEADKELTIGGIRVNNYACSNEIDAYGDIEGIGCFCHEFSHCMGFPDLYDILYKGWLGMGSYDLMCSGSYNGDGFLPAGYSAYEKMMCSWQEPIVLDKENMTIENLLPLSSGGQSYIIYNDGHADEYYMLENRQKQSWDSGLPGAGLMITHVDFDKDVWMNNIPNTRITASDMAMYGLTTLNDHQRLTLIRADNSEGKYDENTDLYPYGRTDSLTNTSRPAAKLYHANTDGTLYMNKAVLGIKQNSDKTISFTYRAAVKEDEDPGDDLGDDPGDGPDDAPVETLVVNDDYLKVTADSQFVAGKQFILVNEDSRMGAGIFSSADKSLTAVEVRIDTLNVDSGEISDAVSMAPILRTDDSAELNTFTLSGAEGSYSLRMADGKYLIASQAKTLKTSTMESRIWKVKATKDGYVIAAVNSVIIGTIQFDDSGDNPCFLNLTSNRKPAVLYMKKDVAPEDDLTAVRGISVSERPADTRIFSIDGRFVGTDPSRLSKGVYVVDGKKIVY